MRVVEIEKNNHECHNISKAFKLQGGDAETRFADSAGQDLRLRMNLIIKPGNSPVDDRKKQPTRQGGGELRQGPDPHQSGGERPEEQRAKSFR